MCNTACIRFGESHLTADDIRGRAVIEVGSRNVNGSLRGYIQRFAPARYLGVDVEMGPGVDEICDITDLVSRYGAETFDVVVSTEVLEHVRDWRSAISNLKRLLKPHGVLLVTTRSKGFPYHGYPYDFWRYEVEDVKRIFSDLSIELVESDPVSPGVFVRAIRPATFMENDLDTLNLYSIVTHRHSREVSGAQIAVRRIRHKMRRFLASVLPKQALASIDRAVTREEGR